MNKVKRSISFFLTVLMVVGLFNGLGSSVSAFDLSQKYQVSWDYVLTDEEGNPFEFYVGLRK